MINRIGLIPVIDPTQSGAGSSYAPPSSGGSSGLLSVVTPQDLPAITDITPSDTSFNLGTWIAANPTLVAALVAGLIIIFSKKKKYSYK